MNDKAGKRIVLRGQAPETAGGTLQRQDIEQYTQERNAREPVPKSRGDRCYMYLLSPGYAGGRRAEMLLNPRSEFPLAQRLRTEGISLGEAFTFMSPLYFRGKLAYAAAFAKEHAEVPGSLVITPCRGLMLPETIVRADELKEICSEPIVAKNPKYRDPLERDLRRLSEAVGHKLRAVLLGSIATKKYVPLLLEVLRERLLVPTEFVGLGNMRRGALMLRCSQQGCELSYVAAMQVLGEQKIGL
ncbi:MAG TPA: hypothetical protein VEJ47_00470 [Candidatus Eremiobacteraceae bacterium]|nr:hypothetical protein [Candidatus Eremiobacteraceae bacterium]